MVQRKYKTAIKVLRLRYALMMDKYKISKEVLFLKYKNGNACSMDSSVLTRKSSRLMDAGHITASIQ